MARNTRTADQRFLADLLVDVAHDAKQGRNVAPALRDLHDSTLYEGLDHYAEWIADIAVAEEAGEGSILTDLRVLIADLRGNL